LAVSASETATGGPQPVAVGSAGRTENDDVPIVGLLLAAAAVAATAAVADAAAEPASAAWRARQRPPAPVAPEAAAALARGSVPTHTALDAALQPVAAAG
jgi:hypothetical protein